MGAAGEELRQDPLEDLVGCTDILSAVLHQTLVGFLEMAVFQNEAQLHQRRC